MTLSADQDRANEGGPTSSGPTSSGLTSGGTVAGRYVLGGFLGRGGMADVYAATDEVLGRAVAIKLFRVNATPMDSARIDLEMRTLAGLRHPGLVTVFDAGTVPGPGEETTPYLVMELITGPTLSEQLRSGPLSSAQTIGVARELAATLDYVHAQQVIHRDLKPANILLDTEHHSFATGGGGSPAARTDDPPGFTPENAFSAKLADFGISRVLDRDPITSDGTTIGTANYLSPEQAKGLALGPASDVYSLGLVLLECLTGQIAYPGKGVEAALARLNRQPSIPVSLGPDWCQLLEAMTGFDPAARPSPAVIVSTLTSMGAADSAIVEASPDEQTAILTVAPLASTSLLPIAEEWSSSLPPPLLTPRRIAVLVLAAFVVLVVVLAFNSGSSFSLPKKPSYPSVTGKLGTDLHQLEGTLP